MIVTCPECAHSTYRHAAEDKTGSPTCSAKGCKCQLTIYAITHPK